MLNTFVLKMGWEVLLELFWNRKQLSASGRCLCDHTHQWSQHGYMKWVQPLCYRAGDAITKYHRLVVQAQTYIFFFNKTQIKVPAGLVSPKVVLMRAPVIRLGLPQQPYFNLITSLKSPI